MLLHELKGFDQTKNFVDGTADRQVVDGDLSQVLLAIDDEETAQGDATVVIDQNTVALSDVFGKVAEQGILKATQAALLPWCIDPC